MKKKLLTLALSVVLCFGSSVTVLAAGSPVDNSGSGATATVNGQEVTFVQDDWANAEITAAQDATLSAYYETTANCVETEFISFVQQVTGIQASSMPVHYMTEISKPAGITDADMAAGIAITFNAPQVSAGDNIIVLHLKADGAWEQIPATAGNGKITGTFTSLSPVFYAVYSTTATTTDSSHYHSYYDLVVAPTTTTWGYTSHTCECGDVYNDNYVAPLNATSATSATSVTSPKTGETEMPVVALILTVVLTAGVATCAVRKANA